MSLPVSDVTASGAADRSGTGILAAVVILFAATMFVASGLLFLVQPMFARMVLPRLGGSPSVWNTCVLFFQAALLLGYLYAHISTRLLGVRRQAALHSLLLLLPLVFLPLGAGEEPTASAQNPVLYLLGTMAVTVGVPFFVLATSAPLLQRWFATMPLASARDPYFLYAASNLGSMLALLSYPFVIEPALGLRIQAHLWTAGYGGLVLLVGACVIAVRRCGRDHQVSVTAPETSSQVEPRRWKRLRWVVLSFAPSSLMLGVTGHISTDVAAVPLLWILPLALYLLTFVLAFSQRKAFSLRPWWLTATATLILATLVTITLNAHAWWFMPLHLVTFFWSAMVCHRKLADVRPGVARLTEFYLWISFGGMLGGIFNTLVAPQVFSTVFEYPLVLAFIALIVLTGPELVGTRQRAMVAAYVVLLAGAGVWLYSQPSETVTRGIIAAVLGASISLGIAQGAVVLRTASAMLALVLAIGGPLSGGTAVFTDRSFFGVIRVLEYADHRTLRHGSTIHGWQQLPETGRCEPSSYYHPGGPVGDLVQVFGAGLNKVGVVGLGTGAMACYAAAGQQWTFYEIDPLMERVATDASLFSHLRNTSGDIHVAIGDGRILLRNEPEGRFDMLVLDAFSSDSIPVHLLTAEAVRLYVSRLKQDGVLAVHISNRYLNLERVVAAVAAREGLAAAVRHDGELTRAERAEGKTSSAWIVLSRDADSLAGVFGLPAWRPAEGAGRTAAWTDDYSNIFSALR